MTIHSKIIQGSEQTEANPLIFYGDIISYDEDEFSFELTEGATSTIVDNADELFTQAFAVTANNEIIYTGYFWSGLSSYGIDWIFVFSDFIGFDNKIKVDLGASAAADRRNSKEIRRIFKRDIKLK